MRSLSKMFHAIVLLCCGVATEAAVGQQEKAAPVKLDGLRAELLERVERDQQARNAMIKWMNENGANGMVLMDRIPAERKAEFEKLTEEVKQIDAENTKWLSQIVEKHGWPTVTMVGKEGANGAWLLIQHADADSKFQRRCLDLMAKIAKEEVSQTNVAYLTDRVLLAEGKKQLYGTQFTSVNGKWQPQPIEDEANVDSRRKEVGLPPLAEYTKLIEQMYSGKTAK